MARLTRRAGWTGGGRALLAGLIGAAIVVSLCDDAARGADSEVPRFVVDPYWPKPLPDRWVTGAVGGVCVDSHDHVFGVNRSDLTTMEQAVGKEPAPIVIEYDSGREHRERMGRSEADAQIDPWLFRRQARQHLDGRQRRWDRAEMVA